MAKKTKITVADMRSNPALMSEDALEGLWADAEAAENALRGACAAYQEDLQKRQAAIDQQRAALTELIQRLAEKQKAAESQACNLASRGDLAEAEKYEKAAEELGQQIAAAERKCKILSRINLDGDAGLYEAIQKAREAREIAWTAARKEANQAYQLAIELENRFKELHRVARIKSMRGSGDCGFDAVFQHFNRKMLEQSRREADQKRREREEAEAQKRRIVCFG